MDKSSKLLKMGISLSFALTLGIGGVASTVFADAEMDLNYSSATAYSDSEYFGSVTDTTNEFYHSLSYSPVDNVGDQDLVRNYIYFENRDEVEYTHYMYNTTVNNDDMHLLSAYDGAGCDNPITDIKENYDSTTNTTEYKVVVGDVSDNKVYSGESACGYVYFEYQRSLSNMYVWDRTTNENQDYVEAQFFSGIASYSNVNMGDVWSTDQVYINGN